LRTNTKDIAKIHLSLRPHASMLFKVTAQ